eukprot:scaffold51130_cov21-Tisochrysis_lutea.AAC.1
MNTERRHNRYEPDIPHRIILLSADAVAFSVLLDVCAITACLAGIAVCLAVVAAAQKTLKRRKGV